MLEIKQNFFIYCCYSKYRSPWVRLVAAVLHEKKVLSMSPIRNTTWNCLKKSKSIPYIVILVCDFLNFCLPAKSRLIQYILIYNLNLIRTMTASSSKKASHKLLYYIASKYPNHSSTSDWDPRQCALPASCDCRIHLRSILAATNHDINHQSEFFHSEIHVNVPTFKFRVYGSAHVYLHSTRRRGLTKRLLKSTFQPT